MCLHFDRPAAWCAGAGIVFIGHQRLYMVSGVWESHHWCSCTLHGECHRSFAHQNSLVSTWTKWWAEAPNHSCISDNECFVIMIFSDGVIIGNGFTFHLGGCCCWHAIMNCLVVWGATRSILQPSVFLGNPSLFMSGLLSASVKWCKLMPVEGFGWTGLFLAAKLRS